jgi:hypothetical protein
VELPSKTLLKERWEGSDDEEEDVRIYWRALRKREGN